MRIVLNTCLVLLSVFSLVVSAFAQNEEAIQLELNKIESAQSNCILTFVVSNKLPSPVTKLAYEFVVFDAELKVDRLTVFDFKTIESGKFRVRQFQLPDTDCNKLGRLLINGVSSCTGPGLSPDSCVGNLKLGNKTTIEFLN